MSEAKRKPGRPRGPANQPRVNRSVVQNPKFLEAKIALVKEQERKIRISNDEKAGKLAPIADVTREWVSLTTTVRNAMLALSARLGAPAAALVG